MTIKTYNRNELSAFIDSDFYAILSKIPISYHRAVSQINNPAVSDNDILLWVAYENAAVIGYIGVLPDRLTYSIFTNRDLLVKLLLGG